MGSIIANDSATPTHVGRVLRSAVNPVNHGASHVYSPVVHAHLFVLSLPAQHPCTQTCHAPAACPETEPCLAPVTLTCPCGHLRSTMPCSGTKLALACTGECEIKKRNARLAEALGIREEKREPRGKVTYTTELVGVARGMGPKFVGVVERAFAECVFLSSIRVVGSLNGGST